jgi:acid phosphatase
MNTHRYPFSFILLLVILNTNLVQSQSTFPKPDHIVICILENHSFNQILGSSAAPYINALANDTASALFTGSYGIGHPSQPNYLALFSGDTQGVTDDLVPSDNPFSSPNLGGQLIGYGYTFITYSEDLPSVGFNGETSGNYARRHNPVANWLGNGTNQIPPTTNQPYSVFPSGNFSLLPTVSYVIPNVKNDMHDGTDPATISTGDNWVSTNLDQYIQWAKTNNSLFILTFDEDNDISSNHIVTIFTGQMVQSGQYATKITHYSVLHTIEKMYGLPVIGDSTANAPITNSWKQKGNIIPDSVTVTDGKIYPNPANGYLYVELNDYLNASIEIFNLKGQLMQVNPLVSKDTELNITNLRSGYYLVKINHKEGVLVKRFIKN